MRKNLFSFLFADINIFKKNIPHILAIIAFSIGFGMVEAMVVIYIRHILATTSHDFFSNAEEFGARAELFKLGYVVFLNPQAFSFWDTLHLEIFREIATMVMLVSVSFIAGKNLIERAGYFLLSFGIWDIFYYVWLFLFIQWPQSIFQWDLLFLLPVPWIAPVWMPTIISAVMIVTALYLLGLKNNNAK